MSRIAQGGGRLVIVSVLLVALISAGVTRYAAELLRARTASVQPAGKTTFAAMDSFALALLLGGFRGPLVMFLWSTSESQKGERNLEDFDTKVEWIRLLQPEFDSVHIFQVWNKAYNISVQMASLSNKYTTILDAIDYARKVDAERPQNINILITLANTYADKLGYSSEKDYYIKRVRAETLPHLNRQKLNKDDPGWRRMELDPMVDQAGNLLPEFIKPKLTRPSNLPAQVTIPASQIEAARAALLKAGMSQKKLDFSRSEAGAPTLLQVPQDMLPELLKLNLPGIVVRESEWNDGSDLQYLAQFQPFPNGISPKGLGYNYFKRSQVLQNVNNQRHAQLSDLVVDSRPALWVRFWAEEEVEYGRRAEIRAFDQKLPAERVAMETPTATVTFATPSVDARSIVSAEANYALAVKLLANSELEYRRHIENYKTNATLYESHLLTVLATRAMAEADQLFLQAYQAPAADRQPLAQKSRAKYAEAAFLWRKMVLKYYLNREAAARLFPNGVPPGDLDTIPPDIAAVLVRNVYLLLNQENIGAENSDDLNEFGRYIDRCQKRLDTLGK